jgi:hypothetical protein
MAARGEGFVENQGRDRRRLDGGVRRQSAWRTAARAMLDCFPCLSFFLTARQDPNFLADMQFKLHKLL